MLSLGPVAFAAPWVLTALVGLPILWLILRAVPPAPIRRRFPGVALLLGLQDPEAEADKTPWWLLLLRAFAVAAMILAFAGPVLNPETRVETAAPLLVLEDGTWASARDWAARVDRIDAALAEAARAGRPAAVVLLTAPPPEAPQFSPADRLRQTLAGVAPNPWAPQEGDVSDWQARLEGRFDTLWLSDGLARDSRAEVLNTLQARGSVRVLESPRDVVALGGTGMADGQVSVTVQRARAEGARSVTVIARGPDPNGIIRDLDRVEVAFDGTDTQIEARFDLPAELRNRITRFEIAGQAHAGAVRLADDSLKRREIALFTGRDGSEGLELLEPLHYLRRALAPTADLLELPLADVLPANPDVIVLADVATLAGTEAAGLLDWVERGGLLLRFAGPRLAASDVSRAEEDPLMPVRLRAGGRSIGGAMSWGEPKSLRAFAEGSPFFGLPLPEDVTVNAQVMAQPDPDLPERVIAALADGTPLVTRKSIGQGQVVLIHVTANAEWSTLPLSGLFVQMLERLAVSSQPAQLSAEALAGTTWVPRALLDAFGVTRAADILPGIAGEVLATAPLGPEVPPGLYAGEDRVLARNVIDAGDAGLSPALWPNDVAVEGLSITPEKPLAGWLLVLALALLAVDSLVSLALTGRLRGPRVARVAGLALIVAMSGALAPMSSSAQQTEAPASTDAFALAATRDVVLAHVLTGDATLDETARAGLSGLSQVLFTRTAIEPAEPVGLDIETDELSFFPFLYWPIAEDQPLPSAEAYAKLNRYLRGGGMILFDTRDANLAVSGRDTDGLRRLQQLARSLDIPPLEPLPRDHVLTRTFYLLQDFPGRHAGRQLWVEAAPPDAESADGMPFRNLNDGVTPVVIGGNDWASAWAVDEAGRPMFPVGRGVSGRQQREFAFRFGVNLIMHVLTGNYKSDQVHVPALLERLGQ